MAGRGTGTSICPASSATIEGRGQGISTPTSIAPGSPWRPSIALGVGGQPSSAGTDGPSTAGGSAARGAAAGQAAASRSQRVNGGRRNTIGRSGPRGPQ